MANAEQAPPDRRSSIPKHQMTCVVVDYLSAPRAKVWDIMPLKHAFGTKRLEDLDDTIVSSDIASLIDEIGVQSRCESQGMLYS